LYTRICNLLLALTVTLATAAPLHADPVNLPDIGDPSGSTITPQQERQLGESLVRRMRQEHLVVDDPLLADYIDSLGYKLAANADPQPNPFTFFIVKSPEINAFAAPGGFIAVNYGLILTTQSESELAAVMAHEIAHVTQHHMARTYQAAGRYKWATAIALLAAVLVGGHNSQLGEAAIAAGIAGNAQLSINFTRGNEKEADAVGIRLLENSGFDPDAMADFFGRMQRATRLYGNQLPEFLSTHPVTGSRIADARSRAAQMPHHKVKENPNYFLAKARLRVLMASDPARAQSQFADELASGSYQDADAEHYGYALALTANGKFAQAREQLAPLIKKHPDRIFYLAAQAQLDLASGKTAAALRLFNKALLIYPNNHPLTVYYAEGLLTAGQPEKARSLLEAYVRERQPDAEVYRLYARAAGDAGHLADAYQNMAEYYFLNGQTHAAIDQLEQARKLPHLDYYQAAQIEARVRELKAVARQESN